MLVPKTISHLGRAIEQLLQFLQKERLYGLYVFGFLLIILSSAYLALDSVLPSDDHFFHIRFASSILERGMAAFTDFQALPFSRIVAEHEHLIYYNFLFYLVLVPFSLITPPVLGIKLFGIFAVASSLTVIFFFLRNIGVRYAFAWTILSLIILAESGLLVRHLSARPFTLAPVILLLILFFIHERRWKLACLTTVIYFYWHTATFFLPIILALAYATFDRYHRPSFKFEWPIIAVPLMGTALAVASSYLIYPGVLTYLFEITLPVFFDAAFHGGAGILEGQEVYGVDFFFLLSSLSILIVPLILFSMTEWQRLSFANRSKNFLEGDSRKEVLRTTLFVGSVTLALATLLSLRFADYFVYFCILYIALASEIALRQIVPSDTYPWRAMKMGVCVVLALFIFDIGPKLYQYTREVPPYLTALAPTDWLRTNLPEGKIIFNVDWDAQPLLYYFVGDDFRFVTGLEPRFLYDYDERLYWIWRHIGDGMYCEQPDCQKAASQERGSLTYQNEKEVMRQDEAARIADVIQRDFGTDIVMTRTDRQNLIRLMDGSPRFQKEYGDPQNSIFAIYRIRSLDEGISSGHSALTP